MFATLNHKLEFRFLGIIPHMYRKGHRVVVEGLARPYATNVRPNGPWEFFISATEVLDQPHHAATAFQRNHTILTVKKIYSEDSDIVLAATNRRTNLSGDFFTPADDLLKSKPKSIVFELDSEYNSTTAQFVFSTFDKFQDVPKLLGEGHSVFIEGFTNLPLGSTNYDNIDKINKVSSDDNGHKIVTGKSKNEIVEYIFIAQAIKKDDERYISPEAPTAIRPTEVLDQRHHAATAFQRNHTILTVNKIYSQDSDIIIAATNRATNLSGDFFTPADDLLKSKPKSIVFELDSGYNSTTAQFILSTFDKFEDLPKLLGEGHSVFIQGFTNLPLGWTNGDDCIDIINKMSSDDDRYKIVTGKSKNEKMEYHFLAEAIKKDDERYISREASAAIRRNPAE
ncbi:hypothetical protein ACET3Z_014703 [Daucus carota]